jgi:outer membrane protein
LEKKIWIGAAVLIMLLITSTVMLYLKIPRSAYINSVELYNDFALKKELEKKIIRKQENNKFLKDSLYQELNIDYLKLKGSKDAKALSSFDQKRQMYLHRENQMQQEEERLKQQYTEQIWKQLNQYVKDYGKAHNYTYIYGVEGTGNLMYADESRNITGEIKKYVNSRYNGETK